MTNKWIPRFLQMAELVATWSKDPSTQVGAVIAKGNRVISLGFNGYPSGVVDSVSDDNRDTKLLKTIHAEENAILHAKRDLKNCEMFVTHFPCPNCAAKIIQTEIVAVYCPEQPDEFMERWGDKIELSKQMFREANVAVYWCKLDKDN